MQAAWTRFLLQHTRDRKGRLCVPPPEPEPWPSPTPSFLCPLPPLNQLLLPWLPLNLLFSSR